MSKFLTKCSSKHERNISIMVAVNSFKVKRFNLSIILFFVSILSFTAHAKDSDCPANVSEVNNGEWCDAYSAEQHQKAVDKQLNALYKSFIKNQPENVKKRWVIAQKAWVNYRDFHCSAVEGYRPSSSSTAQYVYQSCLSEETEKRIQILSGYCEERGCK